MVELAPQHEVTTETVRRDLSLLEDRNLVRRVQGVPSDALTLIEAGLPDRDVSRIEQKQRIASAALDLLPRADSTVILDAGSTTVRLSRLLPPNLRMTVVTPRRPDRRATGGLAQIELHLLPGRVRRHTHAAVGPETVEALDSIGPTSPSSAPTARPSSTACPRPTAPRPPSSAPSRRARRVVVLADSSKVGVERTIKFAELSEIDTLVADKRDRHQ